MHIIKTVPTPTNGHTIELGFASWDETMRSVRNRFTNRNGRFNIRGSSELSTEDLRAMVEAAAVGGWFSSRELCVLILRLLLALLLSRKF